MTRRTPRYVYQLLRKQGLSVAQSITLTAIAGAESGWDDAAIGDVSLQNGTWGPSQGFFQIRTLKAATGTGSDRDAAALADPEKQAHAAATISAGGRDFTPWSTFTSGKYRQFLTAATSASRGDQSSTGDNTDLPSTSVPTGLAGPPLDSSVVAPESKGFNLKGIVFEALLVIGGIGVIVVGLKYSLK